MKNSAYKSVIKREYVSSTYERKRTAKSSREGIK